MPGAKLNVTFCRKCGRLRANGNRVSAELSRDASKRNKNFVGN